MSCTSKFAFAICVILALTEASAAFETGARFIASCERLERGIKIRPDKTLQLPLDQGAIICWGYILALQELSRLHESDPSVRMTQACPPPQTTATQLLGIVIRHAKSNSHLLTAPAMALTLSALRSAFPCGTRT